MTAGPSFLVGLAGASVCLASAAGILHTRDRSFPEPPLTERLLYLRSAATADRVMLSFDSVAADVYWIRAIQHFGRDRQSGRPGQFELLEPLLDLTTSLDPHFNIAYRFGAVFLALEPPHGAGRQEAAVRLLRKGLRHNPDRWQYAHDIGFVHYWFTQDYLRAAEWFERAAAMPRSPEWLAPLAAVTRAQGGDRDGARRLLASLVDSAEDYIGSAARRGLLQLQALDAIDELQTLVDRYHERRGHLPAGWRDLFPDHRGASPLDPTGVAFAYDPVEGRVSLSPVSALHPLPAVPASR